MKWMAGSVLLGGAGCAVGAMSMSSARMNEAKPELVGKAGPMDKEEWRPFKLTKRIPVSPDTQLLQFEIPDNAALNLQVAGLVQARTVGSDGKPITRPYTPISLTETKGSFDLVVKAYPAPVGVMSRALCALRPGETFEFRGPFMKRAHVPNEHSEIAMIAGGTGITPMLQIAREVLRNPEDKSHITLIFSNHKEEDILLKSELDELVRTHPGRMTVTYTLTQETPKKWSGERGRINRKMLEPRLPKAGKATLVYVCGPKGFMEAISGTKDEKYQQGELSGVLRDMGFAKENVFKL